MKTPQRVKPEIFQEQVEAWLAAHCTQVGPGQYICNHDGAQIVVRMAKVSLHDLRFPNSCTGTGRMLDLPVPYCPTCESRPEPAGCFHVDLERAKQEAAFDA